MITEHASNAPHEASGITMMYWHGPWCSRPHDNAFGFRHTGFEFWVHSYWKKARDREKSWPWVECFFDAMAPLSSGAVYVNDLEERGRSSRPGGLWRQISSAVPEIKRKFDPDNFFRVNQNIPPAM